MRVKRTFFMCALLMLAVFASASSRKQLFNEGWKFQLGDTPEAKSGTFDDKAWRTLTLPHDWSIEGRFDKEAPAGNDGGYLPTGIGWYRKTFELPKDINGKKFQLYFEGVYMHSEVYINGEHAGGWPYGYSSFFVDITPYIKAGEPARWAAMPAAAMIAPKPLALAFTATYGSCRPTLCTWQIGAFR